MVSWERVQRWDLEVMQWLKNRARGQVNCLMGIRGEGRSALWGAGVRDKLSTVMVSKHPLRLFSQPGEDRVKVSPWLWS